MLRTVQHDFLRPRLIRVRIDATSLTPVATVSGEEFSTITDNGVGDFTLNLKVAFRRTPIVIATPADGAAAAGYCTITSVTASAIRIVMRNSAGTAEDTRCCILILGYDSSDVNRVFQQSVSAPCRQPRMLVGSVSSAGAATANGGSFTVSRASAGVYTVVPRVKFQTAPIVVACPNQATIAHIRVSSSGVASFLVETFNTSAAATDTAFSFIALGLDAASVPTIRAMRTVREGNVGPRLVGVVAASGNASLTTNSQAGSIATGGTGIGNLTLAAQNASGRAIRSSRTPVCLATCQGTTNTAQVNTSAVTGTQVLTADAVGSPTASASHILLFCWDSNIDYRSVN